MADTLKFAAEGDNLARSAANTVFRPASATPAHPVAHLRAHGTSPHIHGPTHRPTDEPTHARP